MAGDASSILDPAVLGRLLALMQTIDSNGLSALLMPLRQRPTGDSTLKGT